MTFHNKLLAKNCFSTCQSPNGLCPYASWRAPLWESEGSVTPFLEAVVVVLRAALFAGVLWEALSQITENRKVETCKSLIL
jgi:hypothetical protein